MAHVTSIYVIKHACSNKICFDVFETCMASRYFFLNSELYLPKDVSYVVFKYKHLVAIKIKANSITITGERWASIL